MPSAEVSSAFPNPPMPGFPGTCRRMQNVPEGAIPPAWGRRPGSGDGGGSNNGLPRFCVARSPGLQLTARPLPPLLPLAASTSPPRPSGHFSLGGCASPESDRSFRSWQYCEDRLVPWEPIIWGLGTPRTRTPSKESGPEPASVSLKWGPARGSWESCVLLSTVVGGAAARG